MKDSPHLALLDVLKPSYYLLSKRVKYSRACACTCRLGGCEGLVEAQAALKADLAAALAGAAERRAAAADAARRLGDASAALDALASREAALREGVAELERKEVCGLALAAT